MNSLSGEKAEKFVEWLEKVKGLLPPKMNLHEARALWERKNKEEEELNNEAKTN